VNQLDLLNVDHVLIQLVVILTLPRVLQEVFLVDVHPVKDRQKQVEDAYSDEPHSETLRGSQNLLDLGSDPLDVWSVSINLRLFQSSLEHCVHLDEF
jgi:hypothetical protein